MVIQWLFSGYSVVIQWLFSGYSVDSALPAKRDTLLLSRCTETSWFDSIAD